MSWNNLLQPENRSHLEAMCRECLASLVKMGKLQLPSEPLPEFAGEPTHVLIDKQVPLCRLYYDPETVKRREKARMKGN